MINQLLQNAMPWTQPPPSILPFFQQYPDFPKQAPPIPAPNYVEGLLQNAMPWTKPGIQQAVPNIEPMINYAPPANNSGSDGNQNQTIEFGSAPVSKGQPVVTNANTTGSQPDQDSIANKQGTNTKGEKKINWGSLETMLKLGGGVAGGLLPVLSSLSGGMTRLREKEVNQALQQNLANRDSLLSQSPEANRLAKANALQMGRSGAINAASAAGASNMANAGMNGDMSSALIAGVQAAAPVAQATASYDQALANTFTERANEQQVLNQQIGQNSMDRAVMADMTAYYDKAKTKAMANIIPNILGGATVGNDLWDYLAGNKKAKVEEE